MSCSPHVSLAGFAYLEPLSRPIRVDDSSYNSPEHEQHRALELPSKLASLTERLAAQSNWVLCETGPRGPSEETSDGVERGAGGRKRSFDDFIST